MHDINKSWKNFINEAVREYNYQADSTVTYDSSERNQTYILNDVRELVGVRIVHVTEPVEQHGGLETVAVRMKFDPPRPYTIHTFVSYLKRAIKGIDGVKSFRIKDVKKIAEL
tara:strand:- start:145 stop:483 length:339 start_codon:yes stop_codon:yes gene_type:complete